MTAARRNNIAPAFAGEAGKTIRLVRRDDFMGTHRPYLNSIRLASHPVSTNHAAPARRE